MAKLREGVMCGLLQMAIDKVGSGIDPDEYDNLSSDEKEYYDRQVKDLQAYMDEVGPEQFKKTEFDIPYSYEDLDDDDE